MHNKMIERLESLTEAWRAKFDNPPDLSLVWAVQPFSGLLSLNGNNIYAAADIIIEAAEFDVERWLLPLADGFIEIMIDWPTEGNAHVAEIVLHKRVV